MFFKLALATLLMVPGIVSSAERTTVQPPVDRVVGQAVTGPTTPPPAVSLEQRDIVLPAVEASGELAVAELPPGTSAADAVLADQLVAPDRVESQVIEAAGFQTLGVTWPDDANVGDLGGQVRTRNDGAWSQWVDIESGDDAPDAGTADAAHAVRGGTDPLAIGDVDAVQLAFAATATGGPDGLSLALVGSPEALASTAVAPSSAINGAATVRTAAYSAEVAQVSTVPRVITRAEWGAPAQVCAPDVAAKLVGAVVHHTAGSNAYSTVAQAEQQIRNDAVYHISGRGWCDIGYNFVVDKWGNIYEGRAGSLTKAVIGVHAGGFNTGTVGVSMLGTYDAVPSVATQQAVGRIIGWRLGAYDVDPAGSMSFYTGGGQNSRFANQTVALPRIFGHRDVAYTACPGNGGYAALPNIRAAAQLAAGALLINPSVSATSVGQGTSVVVRAQMVSTLNWRLDVSDKRTGVAVNASIGFGQRAMGGLIATWNGTNVAGQNAGPGPYLLRLTAYDPATGEDVLPYDVTVTVTGSQDPATVAAVPLASNLRFVAVTPTRVLDTRPSVQSLGPNSRVDVTVRGVAGIPAGAAAVALNITAVNPSTVTHIRAWPAGSARPEASVLNADSSRTATAAGVVLGIGGQGKVSLYNNTGSTHLVVDVTGYYTAAVGAGSGYAALPTALRALDTRASGGPMSSGQRRTVTVTGAGGVPSDARAVVLNVTSVTPTGNGYVSVVPQGGAIGATSTVNHLPGRDVSNRTAVAVTGGKVDVFLQGATAGVLVDVVGWYGPGGTLLFTPLQPVRAVDTRIGSQPLGVAAARSFAIGATVGLPAGTAAISATITAVNPTSGATYLTAWPSGAVRPGTSDLNAGHGRDQANMAIVGLGTGAAISLYNDAGETDLVVDVTGYFRRP